MKAYPILRAATQVKASCATPVIGTVQDRVSPISHPAQTASPIAAIKTKFIKTGTKEASEKRPCVVKMPDSNATSEMKRM